MHSQDRFNAIQVCEFMGPPPFVGGGGGAKSMVVFQIYVVVIHIWCYLYLHCQLRKEYEYVAAPPPFIFWLVQKCVKPAPCWSIEI